MPSVVVVVVVVVTWCGRDEWVVQGSGENRCGFDSGGFERQIYEKENVSIKSGPRQQ